MSARTGGNRGELRRSTRRAELCIGTLMLRIFSASDKLSVSEISRVGNRAEVLTLHE
jgi:hypothetical protein